MKRYTATPVCDHIAHLGEGPFWTKGDFHWIDIERRQLLRLHGDQAEVIYEFPSRVGAVVPAREGGFVCVLETGFYRLSASLEDLEYMVDPEPENMNNRFNDGKCDPYGCFYAGTMSLKGEKQAAGLYALNADRECQTILKPLTLSNGLAWNQEASIFYHIDTPTNEVAAYDYNRETGEVARRRVIVTIPDEDGHPDGMCIDANDNLWVAHWGGCKVACFDGASGERLAEVALPVERVTSCCFGGEALDQLYITTASAGLIPEEHAKQPNAGKVFIANVEATGFEAAAWG